jgi:hypothetical protein
MEPPALHHTAALRRVLFCWHGRAALQRERQDDGAEGFATQKLAKVQRGLTPIGLRTGYLFNTLPGRGAPREFRISS